jgi:predicted TPR repeat methyltransferase
MRSDCQKRAVEMKTDDLNEQNPCDVDGPGGRFDSYSDATDLSPEQAVRADMLERALQHHEAGSLDQAHAIYQRILVAEPNNADALHLSGLILHQTGNHAAAIELIARAIEINPLVPKYHNNLGSVYQSQALLDDAARCVSASIALKPDAALSHFNLGVILSERSERDKAEASFRRALALQPDFPQAQYNLAILLRRTGRYPEAALCLEQVVRAEPDNATAQFLLAASKCAELERAPDRYVAEIFDADADRFDEHLVKDLHYDTPERLLRLSIGLLGCADKKKDMLDLGCGTGLAGVSFSPYAENLVGVDLSAKMLAYARSRQIYQRLEHAELLSMMQGEKNASYDVILASDVFIYSGKLDKIFAEAKRLLRTGGLFLFSVESLDALPRAEPRRPGVRTFQLNTTGRFAHSAAYIHTLAFTCGFRINTMLSAPARLEAGKPVSAWLALLESEEDA